MRERFVANQANDRAKPLDLSVRRWDQEARFVERYILRISHVVAFRGRAKPGSFAAVFPEVGMAEGSERVSIRGTA